MPNYYISEWASRRKSEIIDLPLDYEIHSEYTKKLGKDKIISAVQEIRQMFVNIYQDIADYPQCFKMPMVEIGDDVPHGKTLPAKSAPFMFFDALLNILISGDIENGELAVTDHEKIKKENLYFGVKNTDKLYSQFSRYGLCLEGLTNYKFTKEIGKVTLSYPDDPDLLVVLKWMADKAHEHSGQQEHMREFTIRHRHDRRREFMMCQYRLLQDDMKSADYGKGADYIADRVHTNQERDFVYGMDAKLRAVGLIPHVDNRAEHAGEDHYSIYYYEKEGDFGKRWDKSYFKMKSSRAKLQMCVRVENIEKCGEHIKGCTDEIKNAFIPGDKSCGSRGDNQRCKHNGQSYIIDGVEYWKCGSMCTGPIQFLPRWEDIPDYIKLVELGK